MRAQPTFSGDPHKSCIYHFCNWIKKCSAFSSFKCSLTWTIYKMLTEDLEMNGWCWSDSLWVQCHLTSIHTGIAQEWDPLWSGFLENPVTQRQKWTAQTKAFFWKLLWERGRDIIWLVKQQRVVSLRAKGKQEGNYASKRMVYRQLRLGTVRLIAGFKLRDVFQTKWFYDFEDTGTACKCILL